MTDAPYKPEPGTVEMRPTRASVGYVITPEGYPAVSLYIEDPRLGAFDILISPEAATRLADELDGVLEIDQLTGPPGDDA